MNQATIVANIDRALGQFSARELIAGHEIVDFLLDLRSVVLDDSELRELLEQETQPTAAT